MTEQPHGPVHPNVHLDLDALADLLAGEGSEADVDHVGDCVGCSARLAELDDAQLPVATALAGLPAPTLPDDLAACLSAALDAAGPLPASEPRDGPPRPSPLPPPDEREDVEREDTEQAATERTASRTVTPLHPAGRSRPRRTWLPAAAVAVVALSLGGLAVSSLDGGGGDDDTASTAGGSGDEQATAEAQPDPSALATSESGRDYAAGPEVFDELVPQVLAGRAEPPSAAADTSATGPAPAPEPDAGLMSATVPGLERLRDPAALAQCLSALVPADGSVRPLAVDYAAYAGEPALVVVLPTTDPASLDVFVVGADCAAGADSTLFFTRVDRP